MAEDTIGKMRLGIGRGVAKVNRQAALLLEISRLRLEAGNLRAEIAQTERKVQKLAAQAALEAYGIWRTGGDYRVSLEKAFSEALELERDTEEKREDIARLEQTAAQLRALKNNEPFPDEEGQTAETGGECAAGESGDPSGGESGECAAGERGDPSGGESGEPSGSESGEQDVQEGGACGKAGNTGMESVVCRCPECGAAYGRAVNYCRRCGAPIAAAEVQAGMPSAGAEGPGREEQADRGKRQPGL